MAKKTSEKKLKERLSDEVLENFIKTLISFEFKMEKKAPTFLKYIQKNPGCKAVELYEACGGSYHGVAVKNWLIRKGLIDVVKVKGQKGLPFYLTARGEKQLEEYKKS